MRNGISPKAVLVGVIFSLGLISLVARSWSSVGAPPQSSSVAFRDLYDRSDASPPEDSLGSTEVGPDLAVLDYRELGGCCGTPSITDIARIETGSLVVHGQGTDPAWVELDEAGTDLSLEVEAEFLISDVSTSTALADIASLLMRNAGTGDDGTVFTPSSVHLGLHVDGFYKVRGFVSGMNDLIEITQGTIDPATFETVDLDGDGLLEQGEPFTLQVLLQENSFSFAFNEVSQISDLDLSSLPDPPGDGDRLLLGRNRARFASTETEIRFDNLVSPICPDFKDPQTVGAEDTQVITDLWHQFAGLPFDCDGDGYITIEDIMCVIAQWSKTCP